MAGKGLVEAMKALSLASRVRPSILTISFPRLCCARRFMATEATTPSGHRILLPGFSEKKIPLWRPDASVPLTTHAFPSFEPLSLSYYSVRHLHVPMRRDLLHLAVVYEADNARQGTAHVKNAWEVHGSHKKLYRQKGTGMARAGWKQSPIRRGGGKTFGPRNTRVWATELTRKVYDQAWRIALSWRYRRGELIIVEDDGLELPVREDFAAMCGTSDGTSHPGPTLHPDYQASWWKRYVTETLEGLGLGKTHGRVLFVTEKRAPNLWTGLNGHAGEHGEAMTADDVDVKDLLEKGRVVMEEKVLREMLRRHQSDLVSNVAIHGWVDRGPPLGHKVLAPPQTVDEA